MIARLKIGKGVTGAARYALGEGRGAGNDNLALSEGSRVSWIGGTGFGFEIRNEADADLARRVMEFDALNQLSRTRPCVKDAVHLALSWHPGQQPARAEMEEAAHGALKAIGMGNARAIFASHNDEAYAHIHIVASKINPATGRAYDLKGNYLLLSAWAQEWELSHGGIICVQRESANALRTAIDERDAGKVLAALTAQRATFTERDLERALAKQIIDQQGRAQFAAQVIGLPDAIPLMDVARGPTCRFTSATVLEAEGKVLRAAAGLGRRTAHGVDPAATLARPEFSNMTTEQSAAVRHATGASGIALIDGQAGTGKSFTVGAIRQAYTWAGYDVIGLAPTNAIAGDMRDSGFARAATLHSELFKLNSQRGSWNERTVIVLDEAAMVDTKLMAELTRHAYQAHAKLILVGDDRQLSSIDRGGMFGVLKDRYGAAELAEVHRQVKNDDRRAAELMALGNFDTALRMFDAKGAIHWQRSQEMARAELVRQWAKDTAETPTKSRFVFAYTNHDVDLLNAELRTVRKGRHELKGPDHRFTTKHGVATFAENDRIQITGTDKTKGLENGAGGTIEAITGDRIAVRLDGRHAKLVTFNVTEFPDFRHGYAGTIYKGQGRTLDQTYLLHTEAWRSAASYVGLTRHRDKTELFVATNTAADIRELSRQMARVDERRAASHFLRVGDVKMEQGLPTDEALLRQADIEAERLRALQDQEERARAFRRAKQIEFEEAQKKQPENKREADAQDGDISSAQARYAIALGENYSIRDPYGSLARAAMSEYAMFHRNQEKMRREMAEERDPEKRQAIDLRRNIEACDYMALTSERLAGITVAIVGAKDAPQAVLDHARAADYRAQAAALRAERTELIEGIQKRGLLPDVAPPAATHGADAAPISAEPQQPEPPKATQDPTPVAEATQPEPASAANAAAKPEVASAAPTEVAETSPAPSMPEPAAEHRVPETVEPSSALPPAPAPASTLFEISPVFRRPDLIAPLPPLHVTVTRDAAQSLPETAPSVPPERQSSEMPWMDALRRRVEETLSSPNAVASDQTLTRLAKRLQQEKSEPEAAHEHVPDDPGPEPDM